MAVNLSPIWGAGAQLLDNSGNVLSGGKIYTYAAGTTIQVTTYTSATGNTANSNPIVLNSAGRVPYEIWLTDGQNYKFVLKDSNDVLIGTWDNLSGINSNFIAYTNQQEIQTATAGQTVFNLTTMNYLPATNSLSVFVDGVNQYGPGASYAYEETDSNTVTFTSGLHDGAEVKFTSSEIQNAGVTDASQITYDPPFTNSVATNVEAKLAQTVSVKDFGAIGDGVTDDTAAIQAAINSCVASGNWLEFPNGTYLTTSSLTNFYSVKQVGNGVIVRGSDSFYVSPNTAQTNVIYVSASGSDANDGLSSSQPIHTLSKVNAILKNTTANQRNGTWRFKFAAGTYSDSSNFQNIPQFAKSIEFIGTGTSRNPQTIFDGATATYQTAGMYFLQYMNVTLQYLKFINFTTGYGALAERNCKITLNDCTADNCLIGFGAAYNSYIVALRCLANNCSNRGYSVAYNSQATFGPGSGGSLSDSCRATGCGYGFHVSRGSIAHTDYCEAFDSVNAGVISEINSRTAMLGGDYQRNPTAVRCWTGSFVSFSNAEPVIFNQTDPAKRNNETLEYRFGSGEASDAQIGTDDLSIYKYTTPTTITGSIVPVQVGGTLFTAQAGWFIDNTKRVKLKVYGTVTTTGTGTLSLQLRVAGTTSLSVLSIPINVTNEVFVFESEVIPTAYNSQKTISRITCGGNIVVTEIQNDSIDFLTTDRAFTFWSDANGDAAVSVTYESLECSVCG